MDKNMQEYIRNLSADYINLTLDKNTFEKMINEIEKIINSRIKTENKIEKIKKLLKDYNNEK